MKMKMKLALVVGVATLAVTPVFAKGGTDSLHFNISEAFTNSGVEPDATGKVTASESEEGNHSNQKLDVTASGLTANTGYDIVANVNGSGTTNLGTFTTDKKGKLAAHLNSNAHGAKTVQLPDGFDITQILELDVVNGGSAVVLAADVTAPASLKYQVKRNLNNGGSANGTLQISSSSKGKTKFSLNASGLDASTDYQLVFNGTPVATITSDAHGKLKSNDATLLPANILDLQTVEVWDSTNTAVLATATPLP